MDSETLRKVSEITNYAELFACDLQNILDVLPQNIIILKDSGLWGIYEEDFTCIMSAEWNESLKDLAIHYLLTLDINERLAYDWHILFS